MSVQTLSKGNRVAIHPMSDVWARGDRFGTVTTVGRKWIHVQGNSGVVHKFPLATEDLCVMESSITTGSNVLYRSPETNLAYEAVVVVVDRSNNRLIIEITSDWSRVFRKGMLMSVPQTSVIRVATWGNVAQVVGQ